MNYSNLTEFPFHIKINLFYMIYMIHMHIHRHLPIPIPISIPIHFPIQIYIFYIHIHSRLPLQMFLVTKLVHRQMLGQVDQLYPFRKWSLPMGLPMLNMTIIFDFGTTLLDIGTIFNC